MANNGNRNNKTPLPIYVKEQVVECNIGSPVKVSPSFENAKGKITWDLEGDLPTGLSFDSDNGVIKGTAEGEPYQGDVTISCLDSKNNTGEAKYTIVVNPELGLSIKGRMPLDRRLGFPIEVQAYGTGGTGQYTYDLVNPPTGITIGKLTGAITGNFTKEGEQDLTISVSDSISTCQVTFTFTIHSVPEEPVVNLPENFTPRRTGDIGLVNLNTAITLRSQSPMEFINSAVSLLAATRRLCSDPIDALVDAYIEMFKRYGDTWMMEDRFFEGMEDFRKDDLDFMKTIYNAFRQIVYYRNPNVDFNNLLRVTRNQKVTQTLKNLAKSYS